MRLQKYLADAGIASRRKCEEIISAGRVKVNGHVAVLGSSVEPEDSVTLDDKPVRPAEAAAPGRGVPGRRRAGAVSRTTGFPSGSG